MNNRVTRGIALVSATAVNVSPLITITSAWQNAFLHIRRVYCGLLTSAAATQMLRPAKADFTTSAGDGSRNLLSHLVVTSRSTLVRAIPTGADY